MPNRPTTVTRPHRDRVVAILDLIDSALDEYERVAPGTRTRSTCSSSGRRPDEEP